MGWSSTTRPFGDAAAGFLYRIDETASICLGLGGRVRAVARQQPLVNAQKTEKAMPLLGRFAQSFGPTPSLPWYGALQPDLLVMQLQGFFYSIDATASYVLVAELELWRANNRSFMPRRVRKGCSSPWRNICNIIICIYVKAF